MDYENMWCVLKCTLSSLILDRKRGTFSDVLGLMVLSEKLDAKSEDLCADCINNPENVLKREFCE